MLLLIHSKLRKKPQIISLNAPLPFPDSQPAAVLMVHVEGFLFIHPQKKKMTERRHLNHLHLPQPDAGGKKKTQIKET